MKVVIPLAGLGKRMRPHTYTKPKPLIKVAGKAVLGHILDKFEGVDVEEFIFIIGYLGEQVKEYVTQNYDFKARFVEQPEPKGQAHAIQLTRDYLSESDDVIILFVDTLFEADFGKIKQFEGDGVCYVKEVEDPRRFGVVILEDDRVVKFIEKPSTKEHKLVVIGLYYIKDSALLLECIDELIEREIMTHGEYFLADAFQLMINRGAEFTVETVDVWEDCGKPETVLHTNRYLLDKHGSTVLPVITSSVVIPPVYIAASAKVNDSVIGPYVSIAEDCVIEESIIRNSIVDNGAHVYDMTLTDSLVGAEALVRGVFERLNLGDHSVVDWAGEEYD